MIAAAPDVLESVAEGERAYWGHATPSKAAVEITGQTIDYAARSRQPRAP
ncbi:DUF5953 family protein [Stigmatella ashevillensis]